MWSCSEMLRFLSKRKGRNAEKKNVSSFGSSRIIPNKHIVQCRVILLDGTDLQVDLSVSISVFLIILNTEIFMSIYTFWHCSFSWITFLT